MARVDFDAPGSRTYEYGVDRVVLYPTSNVAIPWNGVSSISEDSGQTISTHYLDGRPYLHAVTPGAFEGTINAYTFPDEFSPAVGFVDSSAIIGADYPGVRIGNQPPSLYGMTYRTRIGNDLGEDLGYKLHIVYNVLLVPDTKTHKTLSLSSEPTDFSWTIKTTPMPQLEGSISHFVIDSTKVSWWYLAFLEDWLYGKADADPKFPDPIDFLVAFSVITGQGPPAEIFGVSVVDNGDGTWTATDTNGEITIVDNVFTMTDVNAQNITGSSYDLVVD